MVNFRLNVQFIEIGPIRLAEGQTLAILLVDLNWGVDILISRELVEFLAPSSCVHPPDVDIHVVNASN